MSHYTSAHWGTYEVATSDNGKVSLQPYGNDPDPSPIGLHQLDDSVQRLRVRRPAIRASLLWGEPEAGRGSRGYHDFVEVDWDTALDFVAREISRVKTNFGNSSIFGGSYGWASAGRFHHAQSQVHRFLNACGGYVRHMDSYSLAAARVVMPHVIAPMDRLMANHTSWDVMAEHTELFVAFGGVPAKDAQITAGGVNDHRIKLGLSQMRDRGVLFINIDPVGDNLDTGAGHEWLAIRPNSDTALMLALAWVLQTENLHSKEFLVQHCVGYERFERYLLGLDDGIAKTPAWAEGITGLSAARIADLACEMAKHRTTINVAWALQRAASGEQPIWMVVTLACMLGQIGLPGGGFGVGYGATNQMGSPHLLLPGPTLPQGQNEVRDFIPVARVSDMLLNPGKSFTYNGGTYRYPDIRLVYWAGGNPFHHHQDLNRLVEAWRKPDLIVVHEQYWTATAKFADIVLPTTTSLERDDLGYATREGHLVAMRKAMSPIGDALDDFEIFRRLAARLGIEQIFTEGLDTAGWLQRLYDEFREGASRNDIQLPDFEAFWREGVFNMERYDQPIVMLEQFRADPEAHPLPTPSGRIEIFSETVAGLACKIVRATLSGTNRLSGSEEKRPPNFLSIYFPTNRSIASTANWTPVAIA